MSEYIEVVVKPNSKKSEVLGKDELGRLKVAIAAPPEDGKANKELVRFLSRHLNREITIKSGFSSKRKLIILT
jgi:uncharacterized protein